MWWLPDVKLQTAEQKKRERESGQTRPAPRKTDTHRRKRMCTQANQAKRLVNCTSAAVSQSTSERESGVENVQVQSITQVTKVPEDSSPEYE